MPENQQPEMPPVAPSSDPRNHVILHRLGQGILYVLSRFVIAVFIGIGTAWIFGSGPAKRDPDWGGLAYLGFFIWGLVVSFVILLLIWKIKVKWQVTILGAIIVLAILWRYLFG